MFGLIQKYIPADVFYHNISDNQNVFQNKIVKENTCYVKINIPINYTTDHIQVDRTSSRYLHKNAISHCCYLPFLQSSIEARSSTSSSCSGNTGTTQRGLETFSSNMASLVIGKGGSPISSTSVSTTPGLVGTACCCCCCS